MGSYKPDRRHMLGGMYIEEWRSLLGGDAPKTPKVDLGSMALDPSIVKEVIEGLKQDLLSEKAMRRYKEEQGDLDRLNKRNLLEAITDGKKEVELVFLKLVPPTLGAAYALPRHLVFEYVNKTYKIELKLTEVEPNEEVE